VKRRTGGPGRPRQPPSGSAASSGSLASPGLPAVLDLGARRKNLVKTLSELLRRDGA